MTPPEIADAVGVFVFSLSGGLLASRRGMDLFGILVVSMLPAIGGGTLRDLLLDRPVFWLDQSHTILIALAGGVVCALLGERIARFKTLIWVDAMGLSLFCVIGAQAAQSLGYGPVVVIMMGTITASFGGLLRDVVCNEVPLILREDIYATAGLVGALTYWAATTFGLSEPVAMSIGGGTAFTIRGVVITVKTIDPKLLLPRLKKSEKED
ncbi:MAG: trimeric intracellular cation channel family protein [Pseudomonadota bacterium]